MENKTEEYIILNESKYKSEKEFIIFQKILPIAFIVNLLFILLLFEDVLNYFSLVLYLLAFTVFIVLRNINLMVIENKIKDRKSFVRKGITYYLKNIESVEYNYFKDKKTTDEPKTLKELLLKEHKNGHILDEDLQIYLDYADVYEAEKSINNQTIYIQSKLGEPLDRVFGITSKNMLETMGIFIFMVISVFLTSSILANLYILVTTYLLYTYHLNKLSESEKLINHYFTYAEFESYMKSCEDLESHYEGSKEYVDILENMEEPIDCDMTVVYALEYIKQINDFTNEELIVDLVDYLSEGDLDDEEL